MKKIKPWAHYAPPYEDDLEAIEVDDNATHEEIEEAVRDAVMDYFEWGWSDYGNYD